MGDTLRLVSPDGAVIEVPVSQAGGALDQGYHVEGDAERTKRISDEAREATYGGVGGNVAAFATRAAGSATLGASDAIIGALGGGEDLQAYREVNPTAATLGTVAGAILPVVPGMGFSKLLPGGVLARIGADVAELGEGAGLLTRAGYSAGGAAIEGAAQNAGAYVTDVALGDRDLSAEGFAGAMGKGAMWGGAAGGALTLAAGGLTAARSLFPKLEMTAANVAKVERDAQEAIGSAVADGATLEHAAEERITEIATERAVRDPKFAAELDAIKVAKGREMAARVDIAEAKAAGAEEKAWQAKQKAAEVRDGTKMIRKTRRAMEAPEEAAPGAPAEVGGETPSTISTPSTGATTPEITPAASPMSTLERQLQGTKQALDAGQALADIGKTRSLAKPSLEDAVMEHVAKVDPEAAKIVSALQELKAARSPVDEWLGKYGGKEGAVGKFERGQAARDYAEGMRPKEAGYYTSVPAGEGNAFLARGKQSLFRGTEEEQQAAEKAIDAKRVAQRDHRREILPDLPTASEDEAAIQAHLDRQYGAKATAKAVVDEPATLDAKVSEAVRGKTKDVNEDIATHAPAISRYEAASAQMTETLGPRAPVSAQDRAAQFRAAQNAADEKTATAATHAAADIDRSTGIAPPPNEAKAAESVAAQKAGASGALGKAQKAGDLWQALHMMGVPLPDPHDIPVVGPLLSMYLKARVLSKAFGRFGGKVAATAETAIASKAAATRQRVFSAVDKLLDVSAKGLTKAAPVSGGVAAILGHTLFDGTRPGDKRAAPVKGDDLADLYHARAAELTEATQPGAVRDAIRSKIRTTDPDLIDAIVAAKERKLAYLQETMPKPDQPPGLLTLSNQWTPSKAALSSWTKRIAAAEDPASVLETAAQGGSVSMEAAETLKQVYPRLYQEAQTRLLGKVADGTGRTLPYSRRLLLSMLFDLPLDASQDPETAAFLQASYKAPPPAQAAQAPQVTPTIASDVRSSSRTDPSAKAPR